MRRVIFKLISVLAHLYQETSTYSIGGLFKCYIILLFESNMNFIH